MSIKSEAWRQGKRVGKVAWRWLRAQPPVARRLERVERTLEDKRAALEERLVTLEHHLYEWARRIMEEAQAQREAAGGHASARPTLQACYARLGLAYGAPLSECKRAWRERMLACHPDRFPQDPTRKATAEREAREVNLAFQVIREAIEGGAG